MPPSNSGTSVTTAPTSTSMGLTFLWCIIINEHARVITSPFQLSVSFEDPCELIFAHLRMAAPSLRSINPQKISLYKPCSDITSVTSLELSESQVDLADPVEPTDVIKDIFGKVPQSAPCLVNAIICLGDMIEGTFSAAYHCNRLIHVLTLSHR